MDLNTTPIIAMGFDNVDIMASNNNGFQPESVEASDIDLQRFDECLKPGHENVPSNSNVSNSGSPILNHVLTSIQIHQSNPGLATSGHKCILHLTFHDGNCWTTPMISSTKYVRFCPYFYGYLRAELFEKCVKSSALGLNRQFCETRFANLSNRLSMKEYSTVSAKYSKLNALMKCLFPRHELFVFAQYRSRHTICGHFLPQSRSSRGSLSTCGPPSSWLHLLRSGSRR